MVATQGNSKVLALLLDPPLAGSHAGGAAEGLARRHH
jgi:hypothetical protein